jgi:CheY-like chemotaxis protein
MSAQHAQSKLRRQFSRTGGASPDGVGGSLTEVVTFEAVVRRALAPLVRQALTKGVAIACEITSGVGRYVLGSRRALGDLVARATAEGIAACERGEVCIRIARMQAGFEPTDTLLASVTIRDAEEIRDLESFEIMMPLAEGESLEDAVVLAGKRLLVVVPTAYAARIQTAAARRFGARVESAEGAERAEERLRAACLEGHAFDVVYVDESTSGAVELFAAARDDASLGAPFRIVATALEDASVWVARGAESMLSKPVLPLELCDAVSDAGRAPPETIEIAAGAITRIPSVGGRTVSGTRRLDLAAVLSAVAVAPARLRR